MLRNGGNAVDAAVAVQAALGLVEPQSSGIGGGAFLVYFDGTTRKVMAFDGRETAPAGATPDMFIGEDGKPLTFADAVTSGRSTGAPGAIAMLGLAHQRWATCRGTISSRLRRGRRSRASSAQASVALRRRRGPAGRPAGRTRPLLAARRHSGAGRRRAAESRVRGNAAWARVAGPRALLEGPIAEKDRRTHARRAAAGHDDAADLAAYRPHEVEPLCRPYRVYVVCVPPPPSSGVALLQMLAILERTDIASRGPTDAQAWFLFAEASRLMYADRDRYVADPAFVAGPGRRPAGREPMSPSALS